MPAGPLDAYILAASRISSLSTPVIFSAFSGGKVGVHPNDNTATIWIDTDDLINIIKEHGNEVEVVEI